MFIDWLKSFRSRNPRAHRPGSRLASSPTSLEPRTLLSVTPVDGETRVNSYTSNDQAHSAIATDARGNYVIAWSSNLQDESGRGIYAQRFDSSGIALGNEFRVNSTTTGSQNFPTIGMDADGDFIIAWASNGQDGDQEGIYAQRYDAAGMPQGTEFRVNSTTTGKQTAPAIGVDHEGDFVVVWMSFGQEGSGYGIYAQRYDAVGSTRGTEFLVNTFTTGSQITPVIGIDSEGDFVVAWTSEGQDDSYSGIYAQRFNSAGAPLGSEFRVNSSTLNDQKSPTIGMNADGNFVIGWVSGREAGNGAAWDDIAVLKSVSFEEIVANA